MSSLSGGIDFGTSNSSVGYMQQGSPSLVEFGGDGISVPSAIFYSSESTDTFFGKQAVNEYRAGIEGRLLRSLKSVLGSSLMTERTTIRNKRVLFTDIIQDFFGYLHNALGNAVDEPVTNIVVGRPVNFVDDDIERDRQAERQLRAIAENAGFQHVEFQFEPIAAALNYESTLTQEQLAVVVDVGGGTADFTVIRLSPDRHTDTDRNPDILSTHGVHIGGTDFDRLLSLKSVMPMLGMGTAVKNTTRQLPNSVYFDLATWHRIPLLYNPSTQQKIRQMLLDAEQREKVQCLLDLVISQLGYELAGTVEQVKIQLSESHNAPFALKSLSPELSSQISREDFEDAIDGAIAQLIEGISLSLASAGVPTQSVTSVFYTGGSSSVPLLQRKIHDLFPLADQVRGDIFGSVGLGLTIDAARKFR
ncbi:MAG: Hsp70 family protein [Granulosicoccus sp.]